VTKFPSRVVACSVVLAAGSAFAHQPIISDGSAVDAAHAIKLKDVQVSRVVYHRVTPKAAQLWLTFDVDQPQKLHLLLGVPQIKRLGEYRPALVLLGPGLPKVELPFEIPADNGGLVFDSLQTGAPRAFYEPFTGTSSWIISQNDVDLPRAGRYYVVAYDPDSKPGKLWVALGTKEAFGLKDMLTLPKVIARVKAFHEMTDSKKRERRSAEQRLIFDFKTADAERDWVTVNDDVMGGVSEGKVSLSKKGVLRFEGKVSLDNNGGFASIRSRPQPHDLSAYAGLLIRVCGDGQRYACTLRTDFDIMAGSYQCKFETQKDEWQNIFLPLEEFVPTSFGQAMQNAPRLNKAAIRSFGFMISDQQAGPFRLEVGWIKAVRYPPATGQTDKATSH
jgi:NADH dehydrogenase [ubiquinone] 1 alpha subcomplex assembly factor 1